MNDLQKRKKRRKKNQSRKSKKHPRQLPIQMACRHPRVWKRPQVSRLSYRLLQGDSRPPISWSSGRQHHRGRERKIQVHVRCTTLFQRSKHRCGVLWEATEDTMLLLLLDRLERLYPSWETREEQRYVCIRYSGPLG